MSRTVIYSALILRNRPSKTAAVNHESNSEIFLLTAEEGIIRATVYGGPKSKLRAHSAPYNSGKIWIYRDRAKEYAKLSDFDVQSWRPGLRELYERTMAAGAIAETILSTHGGGGDWGIALKLAEETLDALENASEELCPRILVHFLWRWADFLGIQPQIDVCAGCGSTALTPSASSDPMRQALTPTSSDPFWFSAEESAVYCEKCAYGSSSDPKQQALTPTSSSDPKRQALTPSPSSDPKMLKISRLKINRLRINHGCRRWLSVVGALEPAVLYRYSMDNRSFYDAKALVTAIMTEVLGKRLASWDW